jgi:hypothetical protein
VYEYGTRSPMWVSRSAVLSIRKSNQLPADWTDTNESIIEHIPSRRATNVVANRWGTLLAVSGRTLVRSRRTYLTVSPC